MARPWRIEYAGALYHVLSRGNQHQDIFLQDEDRRSFLKAIGQMSERYDVDIFAYVLMDNHYHLLLRTNNADLSKSMQWLGTTYTTRFNLRHTRNGHLFQGRYKSIIVENDSYLLQLSYYIHRNPLRAGCVERLIDYRWSSYPAYAYHRRYPEWLNTNLILSQFNAVDKNRVYREKIQQYAKENKRIWEDVRHGLFYGTQAFIDRIKDTYLADKANCDIPEQGKLLKDRKPDELLKSAAEVLGCDLGRLKRSRRITDSDKTNRDMLIYLLWQTGKFTNSEISEQFGLTYSSVTRRVGAFKKRWEKEKELKSKYEKFKSQINGLLPK
jgi:REP element-mobilizing transposase RayT